MHNNRKVGLKLPYDIVNAAMKTAIIIMFIVYLSDKLFIKIKNLNRKKNRKIDNIDHCISEMKFYLL